MGNDHRASYRYTAEEQRELDSLRQRYAQTPPEQRLEELREIDRAVTRRATVWAVLIGVAGTLVFGVGLTLVLSFGFIPAGIIVGCIGIAVMAAMPALYGEILRREQRKAAPQPRKGGTEEIKT
ncbi:MAG: DUF3040 domain-containing protein [Clostridia bacterium]|nr:DUF3040 domain-containing protein [Clostridia bacterium]